MQPRGRRIAGSAEQQPTIVERNVTRRGVHRSTRSLEKAIYEFLDVNNDDPEPFKWMRTADQILDNLRRYCEKTNAVRVERAKRAATN